MPPDVIASLFTLGKPGDLAIASADAGPVLVKLAEILPTSPATTPQTAALVKTATGKLQED